MPTTSAFEPFFNLSPDLLGILDSDGRFVCANSSFQRDLGWSCDALAGQLFLSLIHDNDAAASASQLRELSAADAPRSFETLIRDSGGGFRRVRWQVSRSDDRAQIFVTGRLADEGRRT